MTFDLFGAKGGYFSSKIEQTTRCEKCELMAIMSKRMFQIVTLFAVIMFKGHVSSY